MSQQIHRLNPVGLFDSSTNSHSQVTTVEPSKLAFFSGQVAWTADSMTAPETLSEQAELIVKNLQTCLDSIRDQCAPWAGSLRLGRSGQRELIYWEDPWQGYGVVPALDALEQLRISARRLHRPLA